MSNIQTYSDLLQEKNRLEAALVVQKEIIKQDFIELREELKPALSLISTVGKMTSRSLGNPLIAMGLNVVTDVFLTNRILSGSSKIARLVVPFLVKNVSSLLLNRKSGGIIGKLAGMFKKGSSNGHVNH